MLVPGLVRQELGGLHVDDLIVPERWTAKVGQPEIRSQRYDQGQCKQVGSTPSHPGDQNILSATALSKRHGTRASPPCSLFRSPSKDNAYLVLRQQLSLLAVVILLGNESLFEQIIELSELLLEVRVFS